MLFQLLWNQSRLCDFTCVQLCMLGLTSSQFPQQGPRTIQKHLRPWRTSSLSLLNRKSTDCMFEVPNLIWQVKQQKSEAWRSGMKLQIQRFSSLVRRTSLLNYMAPLFQNLSFLTTEGTVTSGKKQVQRQCSHWIASYFLWKVRFDRLPPSPPRHSLYDLRQMKLNRAILAAML